MARQFLKTGQEVTDKKTRDSNESIPEGFIRVRLRKMFSSRPGRCSWFEQMTLAEFRASLLPPGQQPT